MQGIVENEEIKIPKTAECDTSTISDKPDLSDSMGRDKAIKSIRPAFIWSSILTIILPIMWFIVTGMVSGNGDGYDDLWWVRLLGGDKEGDVTNGRGITVLISIGWTFGLFLEIFYQGNIMLRNMYGGMELGSSRMGCLISKQMETEIVDERKLGIVIGSLFCFANFCLVLCLSFAWPAVRA